MYNKLYNVVSGVYKQCGGTQGVQELYGKLIRMQPW